MGEDWYGEATATFGDRLAGAREAAGFGQAEMAAKLGVELETLETWENDVADPRANRLQMIAGMLNVSLMWLLTGEGEGLDGPPSATPDADLRREALRELRELRAMVGEFDHRLDRLEKRLQEGPE